MEHKRIVLGYHGCDRALAERLVAGDPFVPSRNRYDWLGSGIYFWEYGPIRALRWAEDAAAQGRLRNPAVVVAELDVKKCFDLADLRYPKKLALAYDPWVVRMRRRGLPIPKNLGPPPDRPRRFLDCAILDWYLSLADREGERYDTVRGVFTEGDPIYPDSKIHRESHVQIAVRNPSCILTVEHADLQELSP